MGTTQPQSPPAPRVLYLVYWGLDEQLGSSLVVPAVRKVAEHGVRYAVISFEKPPTVEAQGSRARIRQQLSAAGVIWCPLRYHKTPKWPATAFDLLHGVLRGVLLGWRQKAQIIHARTFVGGLMGYIVARLIGARFVYHNEGFYPDEQVDGGVWRRGSLPHRVAKRLERLLYEHADGIIVLSLRAKADVERLPGVAARKTPTIVVRSCVDLTLFPERPRTPWQPGRPLRFVWLGSVGGRYRFDEGVRFVETAVKRGLPVTLHVLNRVDEPRIRETLAASAVPPNTWSIEGLPYAQVPAALARHDVGLFTFTQGISEHGCSPTKFGEYWASGLPVVTTPNVSDTEDTILEERVGVILESYQDESRERALDELLLLLRDPETPTRCRRAAEELYALQPASREIDGIYRRLREPDVRPGA
jgi:glycosyltransferase involved in cell wall biosynthesis